MSSLERAWQDADTSAIAALYAPTARILPAKRTAVRRGDQTNGDRKVSDARRVG